MVKPNKWSLYPCLSYRGCR